MLLQCCFSVRYACRHSPHGPCFILGRMSRKGIDGNTKDGLQHMACIDSPWLESRKLTQILQDHLEQHHTCASGLLCRQPWLWRQPTRPLSVEPSQGPPSHVPTTSARAQMWGAQGDQLPYPFMSSARQASYSKAWCHMRLSCRAAASFRAALHVEGISHKSPGKPASSRVANQVYLIRVTFLACLVNGGLHTMQVPSIAWVNC